MVKQIKIFRPFPSKGSTGFTIVELLVVMSVIALLLSIVMPSYLNKVDEGEEVVLRQNLATIRHTIDQYYSDKGEYPRNLQILVESRYLREIPVDPMTKSHEWRVITDIKSGSGIYDVKSTSTDLGSNQQAYSEW